MSKAVNTHIAQILFLMALSGYIAIRSAYQKRAGNREKTVNRSSARDRILILLVVLGQVVLPLTYIFSAGLDFANYGSGPVAVYLGALGELTGLWVFWRAHADLGANWSVTLDLRSAHKLVTSGVYKRVRHPMYAAFLLLGIAQALLLPNWLAGPAALAAVGLLCVARIPGEETMLQEHFGQAYREYMLRSGIVTPRMNRE